MTFTGVRRPRIAKLGGVPAVTLSLTILAAGCSSGRPGTPSSGQTLAALPRPAASATPGSDARALAAAYLAVAVPANHRLDAEVDGFADRERGHLLAAAEADLRAQAVTERWFDQRLIKIALPPTTAATARALVRVNQRRAELTDRQAQSASITQLRSFTARHKAADAAVEVEVRIIRRELGLPPPATS